MTVRVYIRAWKEVKQSRGPLLGGRSRGCKTSPCWTRSSTHRSVNIMKQFSLYNAVFIRGTCCTPILQLVTTTPRTTYWSRNLSCLYHITVKIKLIGNLPMTQIRPKYRMHWVYFISTRHLLGNLCLVTFKQKTAAAVWVTLQLLWKASFRN